jgi:LuxR family transcriptional regulator, maltose regulon positive regulatory protein
MNVGNTRHSLSCAPGPTKGGNGYFRGEQTLGSSLEFPASDERNGMSALPSLVPDDAASSSRRLQAVPIRGGATVAPLIRPATGPVGVMDGRPRGATEPTVPRQALFERLARAHAVTVVSAAAASGKTCLLSSWIAEAGFGARAGWVTVRPDERDERHFWLSVLDALRGFAGGEELAAADDASAFRGERIVERLVSGLQALNEPGLLVIDDLHELKSPEGRAQLERFLTRLPAWLRVVLLTRDATGLGLHRLRVAGALTELRSVDLRFSVQETRELLDAARIVLSDVGVAALHRRTGGWVGGLRLAATLLVEHADPERFVREFSGSERTVAGYLRAEVLDHQPAEVRDLLLRTSVLERVSGPLADALTGGSGSERALQELDASGTFVSALDVGRSWFRYHSMFADLLRIELRRVNPTLIPTLHRAAGQWHEHHGDIVEAIRHAQAAGDWHHAVLLLADNHLTLILDGRMAAVRDLLGAFPPEASITDAELALVSATADAADGLYDESAAHIAVAERLACTLPDDRRRPVELGLAGTRLWLARLRGDVAGASDAFRSIERALMMQPPREGTRSSLHCATALANLGIAEVWSPSFDEGRGHLEQALALARRIGRPYLEMACLARLALAAMRSGSSVCAAGRLAEQAASIAEAHHWDTDQESAAALAVAGLTHAWLGRLTNAAQWLDRAQQALAGGRVPATEVLLHTSRALLFLGQAGVEDAMAALHAAEEAGRVLPGEHASRLDLRGRVLRAQLQAGENAAVRSVLADMPAAERNAAEIRLAAAALALAEGHAERALEELGPVIENTAPAVYAGLTTMEALLLDAAAHEARGDTRAVEASLERALEIAEPDGIVLPFALVPVRALLERHRSHRTAHAALLATILDMLGGGRLEPEVPPLCEPLSDAELRVVRHLPSNLKATEIASELCVSPNTVRTHLRHIYAKLDAHTRSEAVTRARRLGLLAPAGLPAR